LHLMGDLHQPLHAANLVTKERPKGDGLGGHHIVRLDDGERINLHSFWDQLPGVNPSYKSIAGLANELNANPTLRINKLRELQEDRTIGSWVQEIFRIAVNFAYSEDRRQFVNEDDVESEKIKPPAIPKLSSSFIKEARQIAHRRLALAAARMTAELK